MNLDKYKKEILEQEHKDWEFSHAWETHDPTFYVIRKIKFYDIEDPSLLKIGTNIQVSISEILENTFPTKFNSGKQISKITKENLEFTIEDIELISNSEIILVLEEKNIMNSH